MSALFANGATAHCRAKSQCARQTDLFAFHRAYQSRVVRVIDHCDDGDERACRALRAASARLCRSPSEEARLVAKLQRSASRRVQDYAVLRATRICIGT
jgi:hypothetical protein